jgi:Flp pilus assembly protein TadB
VVVGGPPRWKTRGVQLKRGAQRPVVITDAERSHDDQLRTRQIRYVIMMSIRAVCLIVAAVLVSTKVPLLPLWLSLCVAAMVLLPWLAVLLANDRPPKEEHRLAHRFRSARVQPPPPHALGQTEEPRVIDADD